MRRKTLMSPSWWKAVLKISVNLGHGLHKAWTEEPSAPKKARARSPEKQKAPTPRKKRNPAKWWKVLGVSETATPLEIKCAYRARMQESHPDKVAHLSPALRKAADREAKRINDAYERATDRA